MSHQMERFLFNNHYPRSMSKSTFFQSVNYLQNIGLTTLIKKILVDTTQWNRKIYYLML